MKDKKEAIQLPKWVSKPKEEPNQAVIIYAHPYKGSLSNGILQSAIKGLEKRKKPYVVIDLYENKFNPAFAAQDLRLYNKGDTTDELVKKYVNYLVNSDEIIFIYPIWWNDRPAVLKGFCDKVFLKNIFWKPRKILWLNVLWGISGWIKKVRIFTVSASPNWVQFMLHYPSKHGMVNGTIKALRVSKVYRKNFSLSSNPTIKKRQKFLIYVERKCSSK